MTTAIDGGPVMRYTNERARQLERDLSVFTALVNDDLYDLLKWAESLRTSLAKADAEVAVLANALRAAGVAAPLVQSMIDDARPRS